MSAEGQLELYRMIVCQAKVIDILLTLPAIDAYVMGPRLTAEAREALSDYASMRAYQYAGESKIRIRRVAPGGVSEDTETAK